MEIFETRPRQWGNSLGITIPKEITRREHLTSRRKVRVFIAGSNMERLRKAFGTLQLKVPTEKAMQEIDEGYD